VIRRLSIYRKRLSKVLRSAADSTKLITSQSLASSRHRNLERHLLRGEDGATLVETAFSFMVLFTLVFGIIEAGLVFYAYNFTAMAARQATRYAMVRGSSCTSFTNCQVTSAEIQTYIRSNAFAGILPTNLTVSTVWSAFPAGTGCSPSATCNNPGNSVTVRVQYLYPLPMPFISSRAITLQSTSEVVISQ
jgi:Flp pilus assembly protein TadG